MKICFFNSTMRPGGIERTTFLLSRFLESSENTVTVITVDGEDSFYPLPETVKHIKLNQSQESSGLLDALHNNLNRSKALRPYLKELKPDILIAWGPDTELVGHNAGRGLGIRLVGAERANPFFSDGGFWSRNKRKIAGLCHGFVFQTHGAAEYYSKSVRKRALILPNSIDPEDFRALDGKYSARNGVCAVGRMDGNKGFDSIIRAFSLINKAFPDEVLNLYGDGPLRTELEVLAHELCPEGSVVFHGQTKAIYEEYAKNRIFVMMSRQEGYPNVLLEAMASGCACISSDCDFGPSELIKNGKNGFIVPVDDYNAAAERAIALLSDVRLAERLSENALNVRRTHSINRMGERFLEYLKSLR